VDEADHLTLVNAGDEEVVSQEEGEREPEGSAAGLCRGEKEEGVGSICMFITGGPGTKLCAGERGEVRDMC